MRRFIKYGVLPAVVFIVLFLGTVIVMPVLVDFNRFAPLLEKRLSEATGHNVTIGDDLTVSFLPWLSVSFSELTVGNPPGFSPQPFLRADSFEARVSLLPLLAGKIQARRFVVGGTDLNLEINQAGKKNWQGSDALPDGGEITALGSWLLSPERSVDLLVITDGNVRYHDRQTEKRFAAQDAMLLLNSTEREGDGSSVEVQASVGQQKITMTGTIGPVSGESKNLSLPLDLAVTVGDAFTGSAKGKVEKLFADPLFDIDIVTPAMQPDGVLAMLQQQEISLPNAHLPVVSTEFTAEGTPGAFSLRDGKIVVNGTWLRFDAAVQRKTTPQLDLKVAGGSLRLHPGQDTSDGKRDSALAGVVRIWQEIDKRFLQQVNVTGRIQLDALVSPYGRLTEINAGLRRAPGEKLYIAPLSFAFEDGQVVGELTLGSDQNARLFSLDVQGDDVPLANLLATTDLANLFSLGRANGISSLYYSPDGKEARRLHGKGALLIENGVIHGVDLGTLLGLQENLAGGETGQPGDSPGQTSVQNIVAEFVIDSGRIELQNTIFDIKGEKISADGVIDLAEKSLVMQFMVLPPSQSGGASQEESVVILAGPFAAPEFYTKTVASAEIADAMPVPRVDVLHLVEENLPSPDGENGTDLVGKPLIDPQIIAKRFGFQPEMIVRQKHKKHLPVGSGSIIVHPLRVEPAVE